MKTVKLILLWTLIKCIEFPLMIIGIIGYSIDIFGGYIYFGIYDSLLGKYEKIKYKDTQEKYDKIEKEY